MQQLHCGTVVHFRCSRVTFIHIKYLRENKENADDNKILAELTQVIIWFECCFETIVCEENINEMPFNQRILGMSALG